MKYNLSNIFNIIDRYVPFKIIKETFISFFIFLSSIVAIYFELNLLFTAIKNTGTKQSVYNQALELGYNLRSILEISSFSFLSYFVLVLITRHYILYVSSILDKNKFINLSKKIYASIFISITLFTAFSYEQFTLIATVVSFIAIFLSISKN